MGTGSPRRRAQLLHLRSDLDIVDLRGNVDTRLDKLHRGEDVRVLLRQPPIANLYAKFKRMQGKLDRIQRDRLLSTPTPIVVEGDYD